MIFLNCFVLRGAAHPVSGKRTKLCLANVEGKRVDSFCIFKIETPGRPFVGMKFAILITCFIRSEALLETLEGLSRNRPQADIYIASDGPRNESDIYRIEQVRQVIENFEGLTITPIHRVNNEGTLRNQLLALDELFKKYQFVFLLEDDTVPSDGWMEYVSAALRYCYINPKVAAITSYNPIGQSPLHSAQMHLSSTIRWWGIGFSDQTWKQFRKVKNISAPLSLVDILSESIARPGVFSKIIALKIRFSNRKSPTLDLQFSNFAHKNGFLATVPTVSQITNVGTGPDATHTSVIPDKKWAFFLRSVDLEQRRNPRVLRRHEVLYGWVVAFWLLERFTKALLRPLRFSR